MIHSNEQIRRQLDLGEDSRWEFKQIDFAGNRPRSPSRDDLADEIAAFANSDGGTLLCGVTDDGHVQGMTREQVVGLDAHLVEAASDSIKPAVRISTLHRELDGKRLLVLEVPRSDSQHDSPGGSYVRVGGSKRRMTSDERLRLAQRRGQARFLWFDKQPVADTGLGTLDEALWKPLLSVEGRIDPEPALEKTGLVGRDQHGILRATVAGLLICSRAPEEWLPQACVAATCYRGADRSSGQLDAQTITGPLDQQIAEAVAFAVRNMRVGAHKDPARLDLPQYSAEALFEAMANAVVHRDYSLQGSRIRLSMLADRVEIQSPGTLSNGLAVDELAYRQVTRNEVLASVLGRMPTTRIQGADSRRFIMERRGDGVPIIQRETRELAGRPPQFDVVGGAELRVTLPAASTEPSPTRVLATVCTEGQPLADATVLVLFPNKTWKQAATDSLGQAVIGLHTVQLPMTVFAAASGFAAYCNQEWMPSEGTLDIELTPLPDGGAVIFADDGGKIPGLKGRLQPIRDTLDRTYLYASNIAINHGVQQPVHFTPGEELRLTDADGTESMIRILDVVGRSALIEFRSVAKN